MLNHPMVKAAQELAEKAHAGQVRKFEGGPYVAHPFRVALMMEGHALATPETVSAAFLHDVLEDTSVTPEEIAAATSQRTLDLVVALTNVSKAFKGKLPRGTRKKLDLAMLTTAPPAAKVIKLFDRLDNLVGMLKNPDADFQVMYAEESLALAVAIGDVDPWLKKRVIEAAIDLIGAGLRSK